MKVRILSFLLTLCMVLSLLPVVAFAETETVTSEDAKDDAAFKAAINGTAQIVKLTGDVEFIGTIARDVTIDLNGKTLTGTIIVDGKVTVVDSGAGTLDADVVVGEGTLVIEAAAKLADKLVPFVSNTSKILDADAGYKKIVVAKESEIPYRVGQQTFVRWADAVKAGTLVNVIQDVAFADPITSTVEIAVADGVIFEATTLDVATGVTVTFSSGKVAIGNIAGNGKVVMAKAVGSSVFMAQEAAPAGATADNFTVNGGLYNYDVTEFLAENLRQINGLVVADDADNVAYVGVTGYKLENLAAAVAQASASGNPIILVKDLDKVITIENGQTVKIELNGKHVTSVIRNEGTLYVRDSIEGNAEVGIVDQIINDGVLHLEGGAIVRAENNTATSKTTLNGAKLGIFDNYSSDKEALQIKSGYVSVAVGAAFSARKYFVANAGLAEAVDGYHKVIEYAIFVGDTGYLAEDAVAAIEAITGEATVTLYADIEVVTINGDVTVDIQKGSLSKVTVAKDATITVPYTDENNVTTTYTYGEGSYESIGKPVCYILVNGEPVYFTSLQAAIDTVTTTDEVVITLMCDITDIGVQIGEDAYAVGDTPVAVNIVIDFNTHTYTIDELIGANGTVGFRVHNALASLTLKNGTLTVADDAVNKGTSKKNMLVQNFGKSLTISDMTIIGSDVAENTTSYAVSTNNGTLSISGSTITVADDMVAVDATYWSSYTASGVACGEVSAKIENSVINGAVAVDSLEATNGASMTLVSGTFNGALLDEDADENVKGTITIQGGTYTAITYEQFYWLLDEGVIADIDEDGNLTTDNENVYVAQVGPTGVKYLTLEMATAAAQTSGSSVYLLADATDVIIPAVDGAKNFMFVLGGHTITNIEMNGSSMVRLCDGVVTGNIVVNNGSLANYVSSIPVDYIDVEITVAETGTLYVNGGKWYIDAASEILAYVPTDRLVVKNVKTAEDGSEVVYYTIETTTPMVAVVDAEGNEMFRFASIDEALPAVLTEGSEWFGLAIKTLHEFTYEIDLAPKTSVTIVNDANATITCNTYGEELTEVVGDVYTGYETAAYVYVEGKEAEAVSYKSLADAVKAADGDVNKIVKVVTDGQFTVETSARILKDAVESTYGKGVYDETADYDATIGAVRYATIADAVACAANGETVTVVRNVADATVLVGTANVTIKATNVAITKITLQGATLEEGEKYGKIVFDTLTIGTLNVELAAANVDLIKSTVENATVVGRLNLSEATVSGTLTATDATLVLYYNTTVEKLVLVGDIHLVSAGSHTVKNLDIAGFESFAAGSELKNGAYYNLSDEAVEALKSIVADGYVLNKVKDAAGTIYYRVVDASTFVAIVDGFYYDDIYEAIEVADGKDVVTLLVETTIDLPNGVTVLISNDSLDLLKKVNVTSSYFLEIVEGETSASYRSVYTVAIVDDKPYEHIDNAIADGASVIYVTKGEEFTVPAGKFVALYYSTYGAFDVYGEGTHTSMRPTYNLVAAHTPTDLFYFADVQTAVDYAAANDGIFYIDYILEDETVVVNGGNIVFQDVPMANSAIINLTVESGNVAIASGLFSAISGDVTTYAIAKNIGDDVTTYYATASQINADKPSEIVILDDINGLVISVDTVITSDGVHALYNLSIIGDAELTIAAPLDVYTAGLNIAETAKLLIANTDAYFDHDIYTLNENVLAAMDGTKADQWLFETVEYWETTWYKLGESAVGYNDKGYASLADAYKVATGDLDNEIILYADQAFAKTQALKDVRINLNDFTLTVVDLSVSGYVSISNGTVAVAESNAKSYAIVVKAATKEANASELNLNDVKVAAGNFYDNYTGEKASIQLEDYAILSGEGSEGNLIDLVAINVYATTAKPAVLNVSGNVNFSENIYYKVGNTNALECINHRLTDDHVCAYCDEAAVKVVLSDGAEVVDAIAEDGAYWFFNGDIITLKHGTVEAGKHFSHWLVTSGKSEVVKNQLMVVADGVANYTFVTAVFDSNDEVTVQISAPYFNVTGLSSAQIGNVVITPSAGAKITITYSDPTDGIFGDILYWINDNGAIIGTTNTLEYTVPTTGGTVTAICSSAVKGSDITVVFQNGDDKIGTKVLNYAKYTEADLVNLFVPEYPAIGSQKVIGWSVDGTEALINPEGIVDAIKAAITAGESTIVFVPAIEAPETVTVEVQVEGETVKTVEANPTVYSLITLPTVDENGKILSHWVVNGVDVHADELVYKFAVDTTVEAVYVDADAGISRAPIVELGYEANSSKVVFEGVYQLSTGYTMTDAGIIYTTVDTDDASLVLGADDVKVKHVTGLGDSQSVTYTLTLNFKNGSKPVYAKAFVSCTDADGNVFVYYSEFVDTSK